MNICIFLSFFSAIGQIIPERRFVEAVNREAYQYQMGDFPVEWEGKYFDFISR